MGVNSRERRNLAFTLVEILVALGIVLILVAILVPALGSARKAANNAACLSNLRSLSVDYTDYCSTMTHMGNGWLYDYGLWLVELAPIIGDPGATSIDDASNATSYITPSIQKLAICPATSLPPGFSAGANLTTNPQSEANVTLGTEQNNAINPTVVAGAITTANAYTTWAVGDGNINTNNPNGPPGINGYNTTPGTPGGTVINNWFFGSYGFNAWLYNGYDSSTQNNTPTYSIGGDINNIPFNQLGVALKSNTSTTQLVANVTTNNPSITQPYQLAWRNLGMAPTPETPVFFDSAWMEAAPTYLDPPANNTNGTASPPSTTAGDTTTTSGGSNGTSVGLQNIPAPTINANNYYPESMYYVCTNRHGLTTNVGFADGHAESVPLGNLWKLDWTPVPPTPAGTAQNITVP